jgi:hypothetical protein
MARCNNAPQLKRGRGPRVPSSRSAHLAREDANGGNGSNMFLTDFFGWPEANETGGWDKSYGLFAGGDAR